MESSMNVSFSQGQILFAMAFQIWMIVFPIILIRKLNYLIVLMQDRSFDVDDQSQDV